MRFPFALLHRPGPAPAAEAGAGDESRRAGESGAAAPEAAPSAEAEERGLESLRWLPPMPSAVPPPALTARTGDFAASLAGLRGLPQIIRPPAHGPRPEGPSGFVYGLATPLAAAPGHEAGAGAARARGTTPQPGLAAAPEAAGLPQIDLARELRSVDPALAERRRSLTAVDAGGVAILAGATGRAREPATAPWEGKVRTPGAASSDESGTAGPAPGGFADAGRSAEPPAGRRVVHLHTEAGGSDEERPWRAHVRRTGLGEPLAALPSSARPPFDASASGRPGRDAAGTPAGRTEPAKAGDAAARAHAARFAEIRPVRGGEALPPAFLAVADASAHGGSGLSEAIPPPGGRAVHGGPPGPSPTLPTAGGPAAGPGRPATIQRSVAPHGPEPRLLAQPAGAASIPATSPPPSASGAAFGRYEGAMPGGAHAPGAVPARLPLAPEQARVVSAGEAARALRVGPAVEATIQRSVALGEPSKGSGWSFEPPGVPGFDAPGGDLTLPGPVGAAAALAGSAPAGPLVARAPAAGSGEGGAPAAGASAGLTEDQLDQLAGQLFGRIKDRLGAELLRERERAGLLADV